MQKQFSLLAGLSVLIASVLTAQEAKRQPLSLEVRAELETVRIQPDGRRLVELVSAEKVLPGETIVYTITYTNPGEIPAENVVINNPVPEEMMYLDGSAVGEGTQIDFSVDGETYGKSADLVVSLSDGTTRPAEPGEYRAVRWTLVEDIPANSSGFVRYRAILR
ncbi:MAG: hypothetical protein AAF065_10695 [Verrucomicrobiota bacterium]